MLRFQCYCTLQHDQDKVGGYTTSGEQLTFLCLVTRHRRTKSRKVLAAEIFDHITTYPNQVDAAPLIDKILLLEAMQVLNFYN